MKPRELIYAVLVWVARWASVLGELCCTVWVKEVGSACLKVVQVLAVGGASREANMTLIAFAVLVMLGGLLVSSEADATLTMDEAAWMISAN